MNLFEQQSPAAQPMDPAVYAVQPIAAPTQINPLAQLETRMSGMTGTIAALKNKVTALQEIIALREQRITALEMENAAVKQQMERSSASHGQLLDGLSSILARFPTEEGMETAIAPHVDLMVETMGTA
ncbi:MAG: hypothetical protein HQL90_07180 [Magnetococcales bacterium]|nr:hypothetical protein [Magnetococcales bacterium]